ncbi:hypothetical protein GCM10009801_42000 [Streptomyces albiaxialis]|uniref:Uncharacterized protein n=1 Tax=Streptomyces albiaxialis TaxID=329523 RepID=A0ABP5HPB3_9ACTN
MSVELFLAISSGVVALASAVLSSRSSRGQALLSARLQEQAEARSRDEAREDVMSRYRDPLLWAAFDLQARVFNFARGPEAFLATYYERGTPREREYALRSTLFVFAEYLGWVEILRRRVQFLDLGDSADNRRMVELMDAISTALNNDPGNLSFRLFRGEQRAIGETVIAPGEGDTCIGYAEFSRRLDEDPVFAAWYAGLTESIREFAARPTRPDRLIRLQHALMDLIDFLDPQVERFPSHIRDRLHNEGW